MPKLEEFEKWVEGNYDSQDEAAAAIGTTQTTVSKWIRGKQAISKRFQKKLIKLKYAGPFGIEEEGEGYVTRDEFEEFGEDFEDACEMIRFLLSLVPAEKRPPVLPRKFRTT